MMRAYAQDSPQEAGQAFDPTLPEQQPGVSADASQPGALRQMWDNWTSRPENNAALLNFGLQMMQPLAPGQTQMGHFAQSVGAGGEAATRNVALEQQRQAEESKQALAERGMDVREREGEAYSKYMENRNTADKLGTQRLLRAQADWNKWRLGAQKGDDLITGQQPDTTVARIRGMSPEWAKYDKKAILSDPVTAAIAERMVKEGFIPQQAGASAAGVVTLRPGELTSIDAGKRVHVVRNGEWVPLTVQPPPRME